MDAQRLAQALLPLPEISVFSSPFVASEKARAEWTKFSKKLRRRLKARGIQLAKLEPDTTSDAAIQRITTAFEQAHDASRHPNWATAVFPGTADGLARKEADEWVLKPEFADVDGL